ncbi:MAG: GNAT family N-acetyltransferase [Bacteroidetes bacterium]|nr:GNAT family N-acetyltransferase [Bacteroidota bacterium]
MAVILKRTNSADADFRILVKLLDAELSERDGPDHAFYDQFNKIDQIRHAVVAYWEGKPAGCGAIKAYAPGTAEVKRMFVKAEFRKRGIATIILKALESWAITLDYSTLILETGIAQPEAIGLYQRNGYIAMPNYGQYEGVENSVCMKKALP